MTPTIFDRNGGFATVRRVVSDFYEKVLDSAVIAHHFERRRAAADRPPGALRLLRDGRALEAESAAR